MQQRILYVEDDAYLGQWIEYELTAEGYHVTLAANGEAGLRAAMATRPPDLVLLDVQLPGLTGYEICHTLRDTPQTAGIPIVFLTARSSTDDMLRGFEMGGIDYLTKPFSLNELKARVQAQLRQRTQVGRSARAQVAGELQTAAELQQQIMSRTIPHVQGLDVAAKVRMAKEAGGDFFDFQTMPNGQLFLLEADVVGKGLPAALLMSAARSVIRATQAQDVGPHEVLSRVNGQLYADLTEANSFITVFMGLYDPATRELRYANAGQSAAIHRQADQRPELLIPENPPVGVLDPYSFTERRIHIDAGDLVVVCSDGLLEAINKRGEMFGLSRLLDAVAYCGDRPAQEVADTLLDQVARFTQDREQFDDESLIVLRGV
jgi:phosphoserine phosphatase RsbU/P